MSFAQTSEREDVFGTLVSAKREIFLKALSELPTVARASEAAGIPKTIAYRWRKEDPLFARAWDDALESGVDRMEQAVMQRVIDGKCTDILAIFMLKSWRRDRYSDRAQLEITGNAGIIVEHRFPNPQIPQQFQPVIEIEHRSVSDPDEPSGK